MLSSLVLVDRVYELPLVLPRPVSTLPAYQSSFPREVTQLPLRVVSMPR